jgi:hypothetical protein
VNCLDSLGNLGLFRISFFDNLFGLGNLGSQIDLFLLLVLFLILRLILLLRLAILLEINILFSLILKLIIHINNLIVCKNIIDFIVLQNCEPFRSNRTNLDHFLGTFAQTLGLLEITSNVLLKLISELLDSLALFANDYELLIGIGSLEDNI